MQLAFLTLFLLVGAVQFTLGMIGLQYLLGMWGSLFCAMFALTFRFMIPIWIGAWFGAVDVSGLPWWLGVLAVAPTVLFFVPALMWEFLGKRIFKYRFAEFGRRSDVEPLRSEDGEELDDADFYDRK